MFYRLDFLTRRVTAIMLRTSLDFGLQQIDCVKEFGLKYKICLHMNLIVMAQGTTFSSWNLFIYFKSYVEAF